MKCLSCGALLAAIAFGQAGPKLSGPAFEIADVHPSAEGPSAKSGPLIRADRYLIRNFTMLDLIVAAYGIDAAKVVGGPTWLEWDHFDITARVPTGSSADDTKLMLQNLLSTRFGLAVRKEEQPVPVFGLSTGANPKLTRANGTETTGCRDSEQPSSVKRGAKQLYTCRNMTTDEFTAELRKFANYYLGGRNVVDLTELKGAWNFELRYSATLTDPDRITLFDAIDKLGLHLTPVIVPEQVMVVESVSEKPTDSLPGVKETLASGVPPEFEAATIKPAPPGSVSESMWFLPGGRFTTSNITLKRLISRAFEVDASRIEGPDWLETDRFSIEAAAPAALRTPVRFVTGGSGYDQEDSKLTQLMLRALLAERFNLVTHWETRTAPGLKLVAVGPLLAVGPKLKPANPSERTRIVTNPPFLGPKDPRLAIPARDGLVTYQNMTLAQIGARFVWAGIGPVRDATGLHGSWDLTLNYTTPGPSGLYLTDSNGNPTGGITLEEALEQQADLKIEKEDQPAQFLVIDRIDRMPTEN